MSKYVLAALALIAVVVAFVSKGAIAAVLTAVALLFILILSESLMMTANAVSNRGNADMNRHVRLLMMLAGGTFLGFGGFLCLMLGTTKMLFIVAFMSFAAYNVFMLSIKAIVAQGEIRDRFGRVNERFQPEDVDVAGYASVLGTTICAGCFLLLTGVVAGIISLNLLFALKLTALAVLLTSLPWLLAVLRIKRIVELKF
jgi:hypothetical protein